MKKSCWLVLVFLPTLLSAQTWFGAAGSLGLKGIGYQFEMQHRLGNENRISPYLGLEFGKEFLRVKTFRGTEINADERTARLWLDYGFAMQGKHWRFQIGLPVGWRYHRFESKRKQRTLLFHHHSVETGLKTALFYELKNGLSMMTSLYASLHEIERSDLRYSLGIGYRLNKGLSKTPVALAGAGGWQVSLLIGSPTARHHLLRGLALQVPTWQFGQQANNFSAGPYFLVLSGQESSQPSPSIQHDQRLQLYSAGWQTQFSFRVKPDWHWQINLRTGIAYQQENHRFENLAISTNPLGYRSRKWRFFSSTGTGCVYDLSDNVAWLLQANYAWFPEALWAAETGLRIRMTALRSAPKP